MYQHELDNIERMRLAFQLPQDQSRRHRVANLFSAVDMTVAAWLFVQLASILLAVFGLCLFVHALYILAFGSIYTQGTFLDYLEPILIAFTGWRLAEFCAKRRRAL